ncbi:MAG: YceI family protein [Myxococcota bacterium]
MIEVFTFKERALLSPIAHDLRLVLEKYEVTFEGARVRVVCHAQSLRVDGAVKEGRIEPMSEKDRREIDRNARETVLKAGRFPLIRFEGVREEGAVVGELELNGVKRPIRIAYTVEGDAALGQVEIAPSRWGIQPYKALLGALRLQDRVIVRFDVPLPGTA